jgi:hypothetical protein
VPANRTSTSRRAYVLTLRPLPGVNGIRALRAVLKLLLRRGHGQRCWIVCTCIESSPYLKPLSFWAAYFVGPWRIGPQAQLEAP